MSRSRSSSYSDRSKKSKQMQKKRSQSVHKQRKRSRSRSEKKQDKGENTCLYIGNLDRRCPQQKLKEICGEFGPFQYCYIVFQPVSHNDSNRDSKISRGYAFVKYQNEADALKALEALNGKQIMTRKVNIQVSKRARPRQSTPGKYLGKRRSPPRRDTGYRRRSYSRSYSPDYRSRRKHSGQKEKKHKDRDHKESKRRDRSRSGEKKQKKKRQNRQS